MENSKRLAAALQDNMRGKIIILACLVLTACAQKPAYISPLAYEQYTCAQLEEELHRVEERIGDTRYDVVAKNIIVTGISAAISRMIFSDGWLVLGNTGQNAELRRLRGIVDAIEHTATEKKCAGLIAEIKQRREEAKENLDKARNTPLIKRN